VFRVLRKPILLDANKAQIITLACVYLHNFLRRNVAARSAYTPAGTFDSVVYRDYVLYIVFFLELSVPCLLSVHPLLSNLFSLFPFSHDRGLPCSVRCFLSQSAVGSYWRLVEPASNHWLVCVSNMVMQHCVFFSAVF
jgi:hypothetical protein